MYLKRLEIQGFKSFAKRTILEFIPPQGGRFSVTAIVGPNGAGKSNVTDAIRWVMGEQALKHVRAKKGEDIIFSGSEAKGALSAAEVTMILDNSSANGPRLEGVLADFSEIVITRRLYRSGDSEYLVNQQPARLFEIHVLLAQAKFAEHAYSIISQGTIDRLLTVSPAERKDWFDEACGIKEHQLKQHQAALKLERTAENMRQAQALLAEIEPRLKLLHKQVKKLERRQEVELELQEVSENYYGRLVRENQTEIDRRRREISAIGEDYRQAFGELERVQTELGTLAKGLSRQDAFATLHSSHQAAVRAVNEIERRLAIVQGQLQVEYTQLGAHEVGWLEEKIHTLKESAAAATALENASAAAVGKGTERLSEQKKQVAALESEQTELKIQIARHEHELIEGKSQEQYWRLSGLSAVRAVLAERARFGTVYGMVAELADVEERSRLALTVAAGHYLTAVVVADEATARRAVDYLRAERHGVATFLPLTTIKPRGTFGAADQLLSAPGVIGKAIDLVTFDSAFQNIFSLVFGSTLVIENLSVAERLGFGQTRFVTLDGDVVETKGIIRGGYRDRARGLTFSRRHSWNQDQARREVSSEISALMNRLAEVEKLLIAARAKQIEVAVAAEAARAKADLERQARQTAARELAALEQEAVLVARDPKRYNQLVKTLRAEQADLTSKLLAGKIEAASMAADLSQFNAEEESKKQRVFQLQNSMQQVQQAVNVIVEKRNEVNIELAKLETKQEDLSTAVMNDLKMSLTALLERQPMESKTETAEALSNRMEKLKYQLSLIGGIDQEVVAEYSATKERSDFLSGQLSDLSAAIANLTSMVAELDELMKRTRAVAFKSIRKEFDRYFKMLFGGGQADLEELYGPPPSVTPSVAASELSDGAGEETPEKFASGKDKVLLGIDVIANPPGKKVKHLAMLSGGERTLTSIALICAILHTNPSPFVVLDEVEAALDETNTLRFSKIMGELAAQSQFIVVTHNRVTMHAADALYGVVMGLDGVSQLLSVKLEEAGKYAEQTTVDKS